MKLILSLSAFLLSCNVLLADVSVVWTIGGYIQDGIGLGGWSTTDRYVQLVWSSTDPSANQAVWGSTDYLASGEKLLYGAALDNYAHAENDIDGGASYSSSLIGVPNINNGYIFTRIFASSSIVSATPYYQSAAASTVAYNYDPLNPLPSAQIFYDSTVDYVNPTTSMTVVPEPSTIGLLLVGAGLVAFRRMRRG